MTVDTRASTQLPKGVLYSLGLALLWLVLALVSSTTTYHLAPLLVAGTPPLSRSFDGDGAAVRLALLAVVGVVIALVVTGALALAGGLEGPSLLPTGGAVVESVVFALVGGLAGFVGGFLVGRR